MSQKVCVLVSGGADSAVLLDFFLRRGDRVFPVYVRQGLRWEKAELYWLKKYLNAQAQKNLKPLTVLEAPTQDLYRNHWSRHGKGVPGWRSRDEAVYLPGRNILLLSRAAVWCATHGISRIALGSLRGNPFPDSRPEFFQALASALSMGLKRKIQILSPFLKRSKKDILHFGRDLPLKLTFSCLAPRGIRPCGRCNKCAEYSRAFKT